MPEQFLCDACAERLHVDLLCAEMASEVTLLCVQCCGCPEHHQDDIAGTVVYPWHGLASEHRARRHQ